MQTMMMTASSQPTTTQEGEPHQSRERIPKELQDVFVAAAQGKEIHQPPPCGSSIFRRFLHAGDGSNENKKTLSADCQKTLDDGNTMLKRFASLRMPRRSSLTRIQRRSSLTSRRSSLTASTTSTASDDTSVCDFLSKVSSSSSILGVDVSNEKECCASDEKCTSSSSLSHPLQTLVVQPKVALPPPHLTPQVQLTTAPEPPVSPPPPHPTPQQFLESQLLKRGYGSSIGEFCSLQTAYYYQPTKLQVASYGARLLNSARLGAKDTLRALLRAGLSPNACNVQGESIIHDVCRRGRVDSLRILMDFGCDVRIADSNGRTPMHSACWASTLNFKTVELLMQADLNLFFISDANGKLPLSYVHNDRRPAWLAFLKSKMDQYWPTRDENMPDDGAAATATSAAAPPSIAAQQHGDRLIEDPSNALTIELASMVADGRLEPDEAEFLKYDSVEARDSDWDSDGTRGSRGRKALQRQDSIGTFCERSLVDLLGNLDFASEAVDWDW
jgi:Ankyrin repeats (3 copies)